MSLTFVFDAVRHEMRVSDNSPAMATDMADKLARQVLRKCCPDLSNNPVKFESRGLDEHLLRVGRDEYGVVLKDRDIRTSPIDPKLFVRLHTIAAYLRGDQINKRKFRM